METLTLARFLCEITLQEYDYARERPSKLAASCLLLALTMKNLGGWVSTCLTPRPCPGTLAGTAAVWEAMGQWVGWCTRAKIRFGRWTGKMMAVLSLREHSSALLCPCRPLHWSTTVGTVPRTCTPW